MPPWACSNKAGLDRPPMLLYLFQVTTDVCDVPHDFLKSASMERSLCWILSLMITSLVSLLERFESMVFHGLLAFQLVLDGRTSYEDIKHIRLFSSHFTIYSPISVPSFAHRRRRPRRRLWFAIMEAMVRGFDHHKGYYFFLPLMLVSSVFDQCLTTESSVFYSLLIYCFKTSHHQGFIQTLMLYIFDPSFYSIIAISMFNNDLCYLEATSVYQISKISMRDCCLWPLWTSHSAETQAAFNRMSVHTLRRKNNRICKQFSFFYFFIVFSSIIIGVILFEEEIKDMSSWFFKIDDRWSLL